ncbi:hypothetical protein CgunFtcFv8_024603 [Champsocephalus gunnari]|uniref:Uncharacterized protein n=1 Tax=Champsocephalus gunnari TaxID=52237 RepID=A0AAN8HMN4_CHAGU|nr:hypothetical protein CgunFtcFv8_024603 [Champsocephalus gunnari]
MTASGCLLALSNDHMENFLGEKPSCCAADLKKQAKRSNLNHIQKSSRPSSCLTQSTFIQIKGSNPADQTNVFTSQNVH